VEQETDFDFEVIVGEDCSTDGTLSIVQEFVAKYPSRVRVVAHQKNVGPIRNYLEVHQWACGQYVAHLDGDDFALPGKLQAQVDCLDQNPDVSFCVHAVTVLGTERIIGGDERYPTKGTLEDLLAYGTYFANSSVMYRTRSEPIYLIGDGAVDYYFHIERASTGSIYLDRRIFGCYRVHPNNISRSEQYRDALEKYYEYAFDRALELGASTQLVRTARLRRRMSQSIARYLSDDIEGYKEKIRINREDLRFASKKHLFLHWTRFCPALVGIYARVRGMN
jgi:glycosyltransferase involved in cell wall biosynthesis